MKTNPLRGYVIANGIESNGRLLGLVYPGDPAEGDGTKLLLDEARLDKSVNVALVEAGLAYVEPYDSMPLSLGKHLRGTIKAARAAKAGMLPSEAVSPAKSATIANLNQAQALVMWPKLFRRLAAYYSQGANGLAGFDDWMRQDPVGRDDTLRLPDGEQGNMHDTYEVTNNDLKILFEPEDLLITPDPKPMI